VKLRVGVGNGLAVTSSDAVVNFDGEHAEVALPFTDAVPMIA